MNALLLGPSRSTCPPTSTRWSSQRQRSPHPAFRPGALLALALLLGTFALSPAVADPAPAPASTPIAARDGSDSSENAAQYCRNVADAIADARFARQKAMLAAMEKDLEARLKQLEAKRADYQDWLQRRETFLKKADENLVAVMSQMRPDAAAQQIAAMNEDMAAALLSKLSPRVASSILNEIEPARAARLTSTMVGLSRRLQEGRQG